MRFLIPQGIGDSIWALLKVQSIASQLGDGVVDLYVNNMGSDYRENRAIQFLKRFTFVNSVGQLPVNILKPGPIGDENGHIRYIPDGQRACGLYVLMPNSPLEKGIRLENWLPEFETNWNVMDEFLYKSTDIKFAEDLCGNGRTVVVYMSSEAANSLSGHNRNGIWTPEDWLALGTWLVNSGFKPIVVGAEYDKSYWEKCVKPLIQNASPWEDYIGRMEIGRTLAVIRKSRFVISYQSGIGIVGSYIGTPTAIFWRAKGDSIYPYSYVSFEESMSECWVSPKMIGNKHLPLIYGKHDVNYVIKEIAGRGW